MISTEIENQTSENTSNENTSSEITSTESTSAEAAKPTVNHLTVEEDFDWDNTGKLTTTPNRTPEREELENLYSKSLKTVTDHDVLDGTIIAITDKDAVVDIGFKSDGLIPLTELRHMPDLKKGDVIEVYVETAEDKSGQLVLSHKKARALKSWERVNKSLTDNEVITGFVKCRTKGGLIVDVFGIEAFLPGSQIDVKPIRDYDIFVGKTMEFKVVKINQEFRNVVVSHKILIEQELESQKAEIMSKLEKGQVLEGTVKNITSYGVFMDLGGVDGLLHITDISWGRINHPEEILKLDDKINVVILDFDGEKKRIALGLKQLTSQPWDSLDPNLKVGDKIKGKVVVITDYGAFIEILPGVEGLIHVSEMSWSQHLRSPQDFLKVGDEIEVQVLTLDREERKMSLGMKQLMPDPWQAIVEKYPVGSKHKAKVRNFTNFGVFVELEEGVDGLVHISDLSWHKKIKHPAEFTKVGDELEVVVLEVDIENRRLSLGHKQLEDNPWDTYETIFTSNSVHKGTVGKVTDKGAVVMLPYGVEGFAPYRQLIKENGMIAKSEEELEFKVIEFSKENKRILVSHTRLVDDAKNAAKASEDNERVKEEDTTAKAVKKVKESVEKSTLGDMGDVLTQLKANLETSEREKAIARLEAADSKSKSPAADNNVEASAEPKAEAMQEEPKAEAVSQPATEDITEQPSADASTEPSTEAPAEGETVVKAKAKRTYKKKSESEKPKESE